MTFAERFKQVNQGGLGILLPWFESISVGNPAGNGVTTNLVSGFTYAHYSSPVREWIQLIGFNINFTPVSVVCALLNQTERHVWVPFFHTTITGVAGITTQESPLLPFPRPIDIPPFSRIQLVIANQDSVDLTDTVFTLGGVRLREEFACSS